MIGWPWVTLVTFEPDRAHPRPPGTNSKCKAWAESEAQIEGEGKLSSEGPGLKYVREAPKSTAVFCLASESLPV